MEERELLKCTDILWTDGVYTKVTLFAERGTSLNVTTNIIETNGM